MTLSDAIPSPTSVLTIAGSDSGGGAGIQMDLKVIASIGAHGLSAITCLTAQNPDEVRSVFPVEPSFLRDQLETVRDYFHPAACKTGMLYSAGLIEVVSDFFRKNYLIPLVVDPVMVATSGGILLQPDAIRALTSQLFPLAKLVTPNLDEVEVLLGEKPNSEDEMTEAGQMLCRKFKVPFLIKGGHLPEQKEIVDLLCQPDQEPIAVRGPFLNSLNTHGSGCLLSSGIATFLACGRELSYAVKEAHAFFHQAAVPGQRLAGEIFLAPKP